MRFSDTLFRYWHFLRNHPKQTLVAVLALACIGISVFYLAVSIGEPIMGINLTLNHSIWVVEVVDTEGAGKMSGIQPGDIPIEINAQPAETFLAPYTEQGSVIGALITEIKVVGKDGQIKRAALQGNRSPTSGIVENVVLLVTSIIFWAVGLFVFFKRPRKPAATLLCLASLVFGLVISGTVAGERSIPSAGQLSVVAAILGPWLLFHFFLVLPEERIKAQTSPWVYSIYLLPAITIILFLLIGYSEGQPLPWFRTLRLLEYGIGFIAVLAIAVVNFTRAASPRTRQQMKIVSVSCLAALIPFLILYLVPQLIIKNILIPTGFSLFFMAAIPVGMGYAVITQKILDIDVIIRRGVIYGLISVIMSLILAAGIVPMLSFEHDFGIWLEIVIALSLGIIATVLFGPIYHSIEKFVDRTFYKDRYDYRQIIQRLSVSLNNFQELSDISRLIVGTTVRTLNLTGAGLILKSQSSAFDMYASEGSLADPNKHIKLLSMVYKRDIRFEFPNSAAGVNADLAFFIPLKIWEKEIGFLCISSKDSRQDFSADDIYLLEGLSSVAAAALHNAMLNRDVSLRDTFVSIASHELRTPLTSIIGYTELLLRKETSLETRQKWLMNIRENGQKIADMVDDLLNITRIQSGKINLKLSEIDLSELINDRMPIYKESTNKHVFNIDLPSNLPRVTADRDKTGQIIGNLLSNAIKYSPNGGNITVTAQNEPEKNRVVVSVRDQGIGISAEDISTLFKTFHRVQRPETRGVRGSGLGLYIVKEWAEAMGGEVWLNSELNQGSTFFVSLPTNHIVS